MKTQIILLFISVSVLVTGYYLIHQSTQRLSQNLSHTLGVQTSPISPLPSLCNQTLWDHVYHPKRLKILDTCKTVRGTIDTIRVEPDGDYHIRLKLDPEFADLINSQNLREQRGDLVLEPICENPVEQENAKNACENFHGNIIVPQEGSHVEVSGSYVLDMQHGWMEIHPVSKIMLIQ